MKDNNVYIWDEKKRVMEDEKRSNIEIAIENFFERKTKDTAMVFVALYTLYNSFMMYEIKHAKNRMFDEGQKQGMELTNAIYNIQGGNEALRYSSNTKDYFPFKIISPKSN